MTKIIEHVISTESPLIYLEDAGYSLLMAIGNTNIACAVPIILPSFSLYQERPMYFTAEVHGAIPIFSVGLDRYLSCALASWSSVINLTQALNSSDHIKLALASYNEGPTSGWRQYPVELCRKARILLDDLGDELGKVVFQDVNQIMEAAAVDDYRLIRSQSLCLTHSDLHSSNILATDERVVIIDYDNISVGPAFSDVILFSLLCENVSWGLPRALHALESVHGRKFICSIDFAHALSIAVILLSFSDITHKRQICVNIVETVGVIKHISSGFIIS
jgi:hypothetical protein